MKNNILHIGLDVDDTQYHGSALNHITGEVLDFKCRPNLKGLLSQLDKLHKYFPGSTFKGTDKLTNEGGLRSHN